MTYTLDTLIEDCRATLKEGESEKTLVSVCDHVKRALADPTFLEQTILNRPKDPERQVLYEDSDLGFCICAHVYEGEKSGDPHDHGPTWAIYAHIYPTGAVHAPLRRGPTRLLRIEGRNTDKITRTPIEAV